LGGTISKITGGKFANGAAGAAFATVVAVVGAGLGGQDNVLRDSKNTDGQKPNRAGAEKAVNKLYEEGVLSTDQTFDTRDDAAKHFAENLYDITKKNNVELGAELTKTGTKWSIGEIQYGDIDAQGHHINLSGKYVIHTHPSGSSFPSGADRENVFGSKSLFTGKHMGLYTVGSMTDITYCGMSCSDGGVPRILR